MQLLSVLLFVASVVCYGSHGLIKLYQQLNKSQSYEKQALLAAFLGVALQSLLVGLRSLIFVGTQLQGPSILMLISWGLALFYILMIIFGKRGYADYLILIALIMELIAWGLGSVLPQTGLNEVYKSWPYLVLHVAAYMISAAFFLVAGISSVLALVQQKNLKKRDVKSAGLLPGLSALKRMSRVCVIIGLPIYSFGLILGLMRAIGLTPLWFISPRVLLACALWFLVLLYLFEVYVLKASTQRISRIGLAIAILTALLAVLSASIPMFLPAQFLSS